MGWFNRCCKAQNDNCSTDLEVVTIKIEKKAALKNLDHIKDGMKICTHCRDFLLDEPTEDDENTSNISNDEHINEEEEQEEDRTSGIESETASHKEECNKKDKKKSSLNKTMPACRVNIKRMKSENIQKAVRVSLKRKRYISFSSDDDEPLKNSGYSIELKAQYFDEMIQQIKRAYRMTDNRTAKMQLLTVVPKSWDADKIQEEFNTTVSLARQAKRMATEKGILLSNPRLD